MKESGRITVLTGPCGAGKTRAVSAIVKGAARAGSQPTVVLEETKEIALGVPKTANIEAKVLKHDANAWTEELEKLAKEPAADPARMIAVGEIWGGNARGVAKLAIEHGWTVWTTMVTKRDEDAIQAWTGKMDEAGKREYAKKLRMMFGAERFVAIDIKKT